MIGAHPTRPDGDRVRGDLLDPERVEPGAGADDVDDRVDRADLMEVHVLDRLAVGLCLGRGEGGKRRRAPRRGRAASGQIPRARRRMVRQSRDGCSPVGSTTTRVPRIAPLAGRLRGDADALDAEPRDGVPDRRQGNAGVDKGAEDHVPTGARERIEDGDARQRTLPSK